MLNLRFLREASSFKTGLLVGSRGSDKLTQRAYLNAVAAMLHYGAKTAVALLVNPILLSGLGSSLFGVMVVLQRMVSVMSAADGRPTQALKWAIANQQSADDHLSKRQTIGSALGVWLIFLPILVAVGAILVWLSPLIAKASAELHPVIRITSAVLVINMLLFGVLNLPEAVMRGMNLDYKRIGLRPAVTVAGGVLTAGAIYLGFGLVGVALAAVATSLIAAVLYWGTIRRYIPWFGVARPTRSGTRGFLSFGSWFFGWTLVNKIMLDGDVIVLGIVATAETVTIYALTGYVARMVVGVMAIIFGAVTPGMGGLIGKGQRAEVANARSELMTINWLLVVSMGFAILIWNRSFISLWVGMENYAGTLADFLIVLVLTQLTFIRNDAFVIDLTLNLGRKVRLGGVSALLSLGLAAILIKPLGIVGLCLGLLVGRSILSVSFPLLVGSALNISPRIRLLTLIRPGSVMIVGFVLAAYLGHNLLADTWIEFFSFSSITFALAVGVAFGGGLSATQRKAIVSRVRMVRVFSDS